ncbi:phosphoglucomutase (alpha-D-glucose-1,6-bisphosphate-dependent) [Deinococcus sp. KNUC1210]|uniref:phosphoglucomutase (alpha-D-glucose-1,6-bisphosphate-dependent) n=1 Tax=Deinococcus sp. KNUC1210 TaxID=2917691 RepID=UPI001EF07F1D|nr:phosphoglucomutase (alpha-D-glucose-1,6-bisphosphate-dependent) [Deinococcus sp. KNUC1210]ULH16790.1 phosphoglucomutase (alpha-D-glucose-1,6-bisphosphate-dependent) [Deinococcus sp. KNUC1210]
MPTSALAGLPAPQELLTDIPKLLANYTAIRPDPANPLQRVAFGTSGHRGSSDDGSFNEAHILAITQAVCEYRARAGIRGPLYIGADTHALSAPALQTALRVLAANGVWTRRSEGGDFTPTPLVSFAILEFNRDLNNSEQADGIVITPSHNPPRDGGFKYNPPSGGPADTDITGAVQRRANELLEAGLEGVQSVSSEQALAHAEEWDFITPYVEALPEVVNIDAIKQSGVHIGVDPLGGASLPVWEQIQRRYGLNLEIVNEVVDPAFSFMTVDHDGKIRMDCSSPFAMASLLSHRNRFDVAIGNDPDADRHGIVTPDGLMNPNHYLAVCIDYLFQNRPAWPSTAGVGKTLVSSSLIDKVAARLQRTLMEVPVGFKYFVDGLLDGTLGFGGEESAGASFLRMKGAAWSTDKDGIILGLLAAEIKAVTGQTPSQRFAALSQEFGSSAYSRADAPATPAQKSKLSKLSPEQVQATTLAGDAITAKLTRAPGNDQPIGGLKVQTEFAWFAARPSGTEDIYKIYAESWKGEAHLQEVFEAARAVVSAALGDDS